MIIFRERTIRALSIFSCIDTGSPYRLGFYKQHTDIYRIAFRFMLNLSMERTLIGALIPPGAAHVNAVQSLGFQDERKLVSAYPMWISLPFDFLVNALGRTNFFESSLRSFPWAPISGTAQHRALRLACLTTHYEDIWNRHASQFKVLPWSQEDPRLGRGNSQ